MYKHSNRDKLDKRFCGITLSCPQWFKSNSLRLVNRTISLGNCWIVEPTKLRTCSFVSFPIRAMSTNLHPSRRNVRRFERESSDEGSVVKLILDKSKTLSFFIPSKNVFGIFKELKEGLLLYMQ